MNHAAFADFPVVCTWAKTRGILFHGLRHAPLLGIHVTDKAHLRMVRIFVVIGIVGALPLLHIGDRSRIRIGTGFKAIRNRNEGPHIPFKVRDVAAKSARYVISNFTIPPVAIQSNDPVGNLDF